MNGIPSGFPFNRTFDNRNPQFLKLILLAVAFMPLLEYLPRGLFIEKRQAKDQWRVGVHMKNVARHIASSHSGGSMGPITYIAMSVFTSFFGSDRILPSFGFSAAGLPTNLEYKRSPAIRGV